MFSFYCPAISLMHYEHNSVNPLSWVKPTEEGLPAPLNHGGPVSHHSPFEVSSPPPPTPSPPEKKKSTKPRIFIKNSNSNCSEIIHPAQGEL